MYEQANTKRHNRAIKFYFHSTLFVFFLFGISIDSFFPCWMLNLLFWYDKKFSTHFFAEMRSNGGIYELLARSVLKAATFARRKCSHMSSSRCHQNIIKPNSFSPFPLDSQQSSKSFCENIHNFLFSVSKISNFIHRTNIPENKRNFFNPFGASAQHKISLDAAEKFIISSRNWNWKSREAMGMVKLMKMCGMCVN